MIQRPETGSLIGIHGNKVTPVLFEHIRQATAQGTPFPVIKLTQEQTSLRPAKEESPQSLTLARVPHQHDGMQGIADEGRMSDERAMEWAVVIMGHAFDYLELNPQLVEFIDVFELVNEADPNTMDGWYNFGAVMKQCVRLGRERYPSIAWGIGSFNAGTPEYFEAAAFIESGVLDEGEHGDVVLAIHEGVLDPEAPIDQGHGQLIPGADTVPEGGGSLFGRVAYFAQLAGDKMLPVIVSEAYMQAYGDTSEVRRRAEWVDELYSSLWYVVSWLPFTHSPTAQWEHQDYTPAYPSLIQYAAQVRDRENVQPPDEEPPVNPIRELWEQSVQFEKDTGINFNPKFAFIRWAVDNGYSPVHKERAMLTSDGAKWNAQAFRDLRGEKPRVMAYYEQPWGGMGKVKFVTVDDLEPEPEPEPTTMVFSSPVGSPDERERGELWN